MSRVFMSKKKKKISTGSKTDSNRSTVEKKKLQHFNVKAASSNVCKTGNSPDEESDEDLNMFHRKSAKKFSLPSLSTLLSSSGKKSGSASNLPNSSNEKTQRIKIQKHVHNDDIFTSKDKTLTCVRNKQFDKRTSSPLDTGSKNLHDFSISHMFSDGLSDTENFGHEFAYIPDSDESETDFTPAAANAANERSEGFLDRVNERKQPREVLKNLVKNGPPSSDRQSKSLSTNFERNQRRKGTSGGSERKILSTGKKALGKFLPEDNTRKSSSALASSSNKDRRITSLLSKSIDEPRQQPFIVSVDKGLRSSSLLDRIYGKSKGPSTLGMFDDENCKRAIIRDIESDESKTDFVFRENEPDLIGERKSVMCENTIMNCDGDETLELLDFLHNSLNCSENGSAMGSEEANNALRNDLQSSDLYSELFNMGVELRDFERISLSSIDPEFELSQNYTMSFGDKSLTYRAGGRSAFGTPQSMYLKQKNFSLNRTLSKDEMMFNFELCNSVRNKIEECRREGQSSMYSSRDHIPDCKYTASNEKNPMQFLFSQKQRADYNDFGQKFTDTNAKSWAPVNSTKRGLKRRYPFNKSSDFFNVEMHNTLNLYEKDNKEFVNFDIDQNVLSENQYTLVDQFSNTPSKASNMSDEIPIQHSFSRVKRQVKSFVKEWLDREDGIGRAMTEGYGYKERLLPAHRFLDIGGEKTAVFNSTVEQKKIDIHPRMLLSNYSCEYDKAYMIDCFKPVTNLAK